MPYLQVDLDALDEFDGVAMQTGLTAGDVAIGLLKLWRDCFRKKTAYVAREALGRFFRCDLDKLVAALEHCGFIDRPADRPDIHVRGAEKRLGILRARSEAGKKASGNLRQNRAQPEVCSGLPPGSAGVDPVRDPEQNTGSYSQQPAASSQKASSQKASSDLFGATAPPKMAAKKPRAEKPTNPRHEPVRRRLLATFRTLREADYAFDGGKDAKALADLLGFTQDDDEIERRWARALGLPRWPGCSTLAHLRDRWNDLAGAFPTGPPKDFTKGRVAAEAIDWRDTKDEVGNGF